MGIEEGDDHHIDVDQNSSVLFEYLHSIHLMSLERMKHDEIVVEWHVGRIGDSGRIVALNMGFPAGRYSLD